MSDDNKPEKLTLRDTDIVTRSLLDRRAFLATAVVGAASLATTRAQAQGVTDQDGGNTADPAGQGRGTGFTDNDTGSTADPIGYGLGPRTTRPTVQTGTGNINR